MDLDDTLVPSTRIYGHALEAAGIDPESADYKEARRRVKARLGPGHVAARNRLLYFKELASVRGQSFAASPLLERMTRYEEALAREFREQWNLLGRAELLARWRQKWPIVLVTNENVRTQMLKVGALDPSGALFKDVIVSEEHGVEKPDRRLFEEALARLDLPPENCLMVGDDLEADIRSSLSLGLRAVWTREFLGSDAILPADLAKAGVETIDRLDQLTALLEADS